MSREPRSRPHGIHLTGRLRAEDSAQPALVGSTILLVEDDSDTVSLLQLVLQDAGAVLKQAATAREAAGLLRALLPQRGQAQPRAAGGDRIDLIVLDLLLSDGDGAAMLLELHSAGYRLPPVVVMSAAGRAKVDAAAERLGASGVVYKPFALTTLLSCVSDALRR